MEQQHPAQMIAAIVGGLLLSSSTKRHVPLHGNPRQSIGVNELIKKVKKDQVRKIVQVNDADLGAKRRLQAQVQADFICQVPFSSHWAQ